MTGEPQLNDENNRPNGKSHHTLPPEPATPTFSISPDVEKIMLAGQEIRRVTQYIKECLTEVVDQLLDGYPGHETTIANILEGESQRVRSLHEQKVRRERETRRAKEPSSVTNGSSEGSVSNGIQGVSGRQSESDDGPKGSSGGNTGQR